MWLDADTGRWIWLQYLGQATGNHQCVIKTCTSSLKRRIPFQTSLQSKLILLSFLIIELETMNNIFNNYDTANRVKIIITSM